jgi:hypothetical protein
VHSSSRACQAGGCGLPSSGLRTPSAIRSAVDVLFDAFVDEDQRARWLPDAALRERTATRPKSARFDWENGETRIHATFADRGDGRATASVSHEPFPTPPRPRG